MYNPPEWFGEEVCDVFITWDVQNIYQPVLYAVLDEMVTYFDVLHP